MSTGKKLLKCYVEPEVEMEFRKLHPSYGEVSRVLARLVGKYVEVEGRRRAGVGK